MGLPGREPQRGPRHVREKSTEEENEEGTRRETIIVLFTKQSACTDATAMDSSPPTKPAPMLLQRVEVFGK